MREIKFRGKRLDNGEWVVGSYIEAENRDRSIAHQIIPYKAGLVVREVDAATVGQYTGLKDKNGKDIYEGDIETWKEYGHVMVGFVIWSPLGVFIGRSAGNGVDRIGVAYTCENATIIGNIHDNPELLKTE